MHRKLLKVYVTYAVLYSYNLFYSSCSYCTSVLYISILSLLSVQFIQNRCPIVVIRLLKAQRPKFNADFSNLKGPKKVGQGPKFGPGAHGMDNPGVHYDFDYLIKNNCINT